MFTKFKSLAKHLTPKEGKTEEKAEAEVPSAVRYLGTLKEYALLMEYKRVAQQAPAGVYVLPSTSSLSLWHGLIFIRKGHYRKAILPFTVSIPPTYPTLPPTVTFPSLPFHPLISPHGVLSLSPSLLPWSPHAHLLLHVLAHLKKAFYRVDWWTEPAQGNPLATELWRTDKTDFTRRVERVVKDSLEGVGEAGKEMRVGRAREVHERVWERVQERWAKEERGEGVGPIVEWFKPGVHGLVDEEAVDTAKMRLAVTAEEEREWVEEEGRRRAEERRRRISAAVAAQEPVGVGGAVELDGGDEGEGVGAPSPYALDEGDGDDALLP